MDLNLRALDAAVVVEMTISYMNKAEFSCVARIVAGLCPYRKFSAT